MFVLSAMSVLLIRRLSYVFIDLFRVTIHFLSREGEKATVQAKVGDNLLDTIIDQEVDMDGFGQSLFNIPTIKARKRTGTSLFNTSHSVLVVHYNKHIVIIIYPPALFQNQPLFKYSHSFEPFSTVLFH